MKQNKIAKIMIYLQIKEQQKIKAKKIASKLNSMNN